MFNAKSYITSRIKGYRSGLEFKVQKDLQDKGIDAKYEPLKIEWEDLAYRKYTPDFLLPNGILIETKGLFTAQDRRKHLLIKRQHPNLDIRFVFESIKRKLNKKSKTTYADWCDKHGFTFSLKLIPQEWIDEASVGTHGNFIKYTGEKCNEQNG